MNKKQVSYKQKQQNLRETLKEPSSLMDEAQVDRKPANIFESFLGKSPQEKVPSKKRRKEGSFFSYQEHYESVVVKDEVKKLVEQIREEIKLLKKADKTFLNQVKDVEKITIGSLPEKPGIYHVRFLETVLEMLRALRLKVGESKTWLDALKSKKAKRGSAFLVRSKKKGTQYSLSQELSSARSVQ